MKVAVVAEYYPRRADPVLGVWAHRQALAVARAGVQTRVVVLHRLVPPRAALRSGRAATSRELAARLRQPRHEVRDGIPVTYVPYVSPPRPSFYAYWGAWSAPALGLALRALRRSFDFDLVHAHNAVPAGDAVRRVHPHMPLVVSVHGSDVLYTARAGVAGARAVRRTLEAASVVVANSAGTGELAAAYGARRVRVVHLGADIPRGADGGAAAEHPLERLAQELPEPTLVTVAHLVARKRHADVVRAVAALAARHPRLRYLVVGDGPERDSLLALAASLGVAERVEMAGQLSPGEALERMWRGTLFVMPSTEEAFGVSYIEAMAGGVPAIGARGEPGPEEIAGAGGGIELVKAGDVDALARLIDELLSSPERLRALGERARATVSEHFTWQRCAEQTLGAYELAMR